MKQQQIDRDPEELLESFEPVTLDALDARAALHGLELDWQRAPGDGCAIVETKTEDGEGLCDRLMEESGVDAVSLSKPAWASARSWPRTPSPAGRAARAGVSPRGLSPARAAALIAP